MDKWDNPFLKSLGPPCFSPYFLFTYHNEYASIVMTNWHGSSGTSSTSCPILHLVCIHICFVLFQCRWCSSSCSVVNFLSVLCCFQYLLHWSSFCQLAFLLPPPLIPAELLLIYKVQLRCHLQEACDFLVSGRCPSSVFSQDPQLPQSTLLTRAFGVYLPGFPIYRVSSLRPTTVWSLPCVGPV